MRAIAAPMAGFMRTVIEKWAPARRQAAMTSAA
jgi:hypothetical protein